MRSIIKYPGSKFRIAKQIISYFPEHRTYLEPFFGSGAVLFNKDRSAIETVNDLDQDVVCFFEWVKNDPENWPMKSLLHHMPERYTKMPVRKFLRILSSRQYFFVSG